jgi:hypothetical protein
MPAIDWIGVLVAWVAGWLVQGIWYMVLGRPWMAALGWNAADMAPERRRMPMGPMLLSIVADFIMALMLAGIVGHLGGPTIPIGFISAALVWFGFVLTTISVNNAFQRRTVMLTVIDSGGWLAVLLVQGVVLGLFR